MTKVGIKQSVPVKPDSVEKPVDIRVATVASILRDTDTESTCTDATPERSFEQKYDADGFEILWEREGYEEIVEKRGLIRRFSFFSNVNAIAWKVRRITTRPMRKVFNERRRSTVMSWIKYPKRYFSYAGRLNLIFKKEVERSQKQNKVFWTEKLYRKLGNNFLVTILSNQLDWLGEFEDCFEYQYLQDWHLSDEIKDAPIMFHRDVARVFRKVQNIAIRLHIPFARIVESKFDYNLLRESIETFLQSEDTVNILEHPLVIDIRKRESLYHRYFASNKVDATEIKKFVDPTGRNILHYLTLANKEKLVKEAVKKVPSLVYQNSGKEVPALVFAAQNKNVEILRLCLFAIKFLPYREKEKLIEEAFSMARDRCFQYGILLLGDYIEWHPSLSYSVNKNREHYKYYLEDLLTSKESIEAIRGSYGDNLLIALVQNRDYELIDLLLKKCPELIDKKNDADETALSIASQRGDSQTLSRLLAEWVPLGLENIDVLNKALIVAFEKRQYPCCFLLLENGADPFLIVSDNLVEDTFINVLFDFQQKRIVTLLSEGIESKESFDMIVERMNTTLRLARKLEKYPQELFLRRKSLELISKEQERLYTSNLAKSLFELIQDCQKILSNMDVNQGDVSSSLLSAHERVSEVLSNPSLSSTELRDLLTKDLSLDILLDHEKLLDEGVIERSIHEMQGFQFEPSLEKKVSKNIIQNYLCKKKKITKNHALRQAINNREYFEAAYLLRHGAEATALGTQEEKKGLVNAIIAWRVELIKTELQETFQASYHRFSNELLKKGFYHLVLTGFNRDENFSDEALSSFIENMLQQIFIAKGESKEPAVPITQEAINTFFQQALDTKDYFGIWMLLFASAKIPDSLTSEDELIIKQALLYCVFGKVFSEVEITEEMMTYLLTFYNNFPSNEAFYFLFQNGARINSLSKLEVLGIARRKWGLEYVGDILLALEIDAKLQSAIVVAQSEFSGNRRPILKSIFASEKVADKVWKILKEGASGVRLSNATKEVIKSSISQKLGCGPKGNDQLLVASVFESDNVGAQRFILCEHVNIAIKGDLDKIKDPGTRNYIQLEAHLKRAVENRNSKDIWLALHMGAFGKGLSRVDRRVVELAISQVLEIDPTEDTELLINCGVVRGNVGVVKFFLNKSSDLEKVVDLGLTKDPNIKAYIKSFRPFLF